MERLIDLRRDLYSATALKKAAYKFSDRAYIAFTPSSDRSVVMSVRAKNPSVDLETVCGDLLNELIDQDLRESVAKETEALRNLIVAHALSRASLIHSDLEDADFRSAPELQAGPATKTT